MNKDNVLFAIIGLLAGGFVGFMFANTINIHELPVTTMTPAVARAENQIANNQNQNLPPNHPAIGGVNAPNPSGGAALPEVTAALQKAQAQPNDFTSQVEAGDLYYEIKQFDNALKFYEQANKIHPDSPEIMVKLGNTLFDAERFEAAEKWYVAALAKNPDDINVRTDLGLTFYLRQPPDLDRAIKEYNISLKKTPDHELTLQNLAIALKEKGDAQAAQAVLDKLAKINPNNTLIQKANAR
ncbi:MAG: tetratricopeptide repeat protein [Pyrinomonadaceae bacterium]